MARLRIRIELNRGGAGVPLHKLASVVEEAQKFFHMLAEDVRVDRQGEWLGFDFDNESLNFTAEYVGPVTAEQVDAFYAAFDGSTSLRRSTIAQFTRIAGAIGEDELIGFGLYHSDDGGEPDEWRCLSRRDALRIAEEIRLLAMEGADEDAESRLPAVAGSAAPVRLFKDRRDRGDEKMAEFVRGIETNLTQRITRLESEVAGHGGQIQDLRTRSAVTEESFRNLLSAVETFCDQATRQLERTAQHAALPAPAVVKEAATSVSDVSAPAQTPRNWRPAIITVGLAAGLVAVSLLLWWPASGDNQSQSVSAATRQQQPPDPKPSAQPPPAVAATPAPVLPSSQKIATAARRKEPETRTADTPATSIQPGPPMKLEIEVSEHAWISLTSADGTRLLTRLLEPGDTRVFELSQPATVRTGNAGGTILRLNGQPTGPIGGRGEVRAVLFRDGKFELVKAQ